MFEAATPEMIALRGSPVHGYGVFARAPISRGTAVIECRGVLTRAEDLADDVRAMQVGPGLYLAEDPSAPGVDDYINHHCEPNLGFLWGDLTLYALRDIAVGDEVSFDYSTTMNEAGWSMACRCGSRRCRGVVKSFDELSSAERRALRRIALGYLR